MSSFLALLEDSLESTKGDLEPVFSSEFCLV